MDQQDSESVVQNLLSALENEPRIDFHHHPLNVTLSNGQLIIEGLAKDITAKKLAQSLAYRHAPHVPIVNQLRVTAARTHEEGVLRDEVINTLLRESAFGECTIRVARGGGFETLRDMGGQACGWVDIEVDDATVTLTGEVNSLTHRRLAEVLVWWTAGCEVVHNRLRVVPSESDNDGELVDALRIVLEKDPLVHAGQLSLRAADGRVTLDGYLASEEERQLALLDAWYIPGVHEVVDRIQTRV